MNPTSPDIITKEQLQQIAAGDETAFRQLFHAYRRRIFTYLFRMTHSAETAEDLMQEVFLNAWSIKEKLPAVDNINAYLHRMAHNSAYHHLRRMAREQLVIHELQRQHTGAEITKDGLLSKEIQQCITGLIDRMTPSQRRIFLLSREKGLKQQEIADELGLSLVTVKKHMSDALRFLRDELGQQYGMQAVAIVVVMGL